MGSGASWVRRAGRKGAFGWLVRDEQTGAERVEAELDPALVPGQAGNRARTSGASAHSERTMLRWGSR
jgi:hypothetical protein